MTTLRNLTQTRPSNPFVVASVKINPAPAKAAVDYDYCGSFASAQRAADERVETGTYRRITFHRMRTTKGRKPGTKRYSYRSAPVVLFSLVEEIRL